MCKILMAAELCTSRFEAQARVPVVPSLSLLATESRLESQRSRGLLVFSSPGEEDEQKGTLGKEACIAQHGPGGPQPQFLCCYPGLSLSSLPRLAGSLRSESRSEAEPGLVWRSGPLSLRNQIGVRIRLRSFL